MCPLGDFDSFNEGQPFRFINFGKLYQYNVMTLKDPARLNFGEVFSQLPKDYRFSLATNMNSGNLCNRIKNWSVLFQFVMTWFFLSNETANRTKRLILKRSKVMRVVNLIVRLDKRQLLKCGTPLQYSLAYFFSFLFWEIWYLVKKWGNYELDLDSLTYVWSVNIDNKCTVNDHRLRDVRVLSATTSLQNIPWIVNAIGYRYKMSCPRWHK